MVESASGADDREQVELELELLQTAVHAVRRCLGPGATVTPSRSTEFYLEVAWQVLTAVGVILGANTAASLVDTRFRHVSRIGENSWLRDERYELFRAAYGYAASRTRAIVPLSKVTPEEAYWIWAIIQSGHESELRRRERATTERGASGDEVRG